MTDTPQNPENPTPAPSQQPVPQRQTVPPPINPAKKNQFPDPTFCAIEGESSFSQTLNHLLKKPLSLMFEMRTEPVKFLLSLGVIILISLAIFGFVLGLFSAGAQLWAAPVKVVAGVLFSAIICLPSLYIFSALGGVDVKFSTIAGAMLCFIAITSLLLVGFAPVVWLFSTSSNSIVFFGFLSLVIWLICLVFGLRVMTRTGTHYGARNTSQLFIWSIIFTTVTLQMTTSLRPIIGTSEQFLNLEEKRFFLRHWGEVISERTKTPASDRVEY